MPLSNGLGRRISDPIGWLITYVKTHGFEMLFNRWYGLYRGIVIDREDPEARGRVRIKIPAIGHVEDADVPLGVWALPCQSGQSVGESRELHGFVYVPNLGDQVFVMFEKGITSNPVYIGGWAPHNGASRGSFTTTDVMGIRTKSGHVLRFEDGGGVRLSRGVDGEETSTLLSLGADGNVVLSASSGAQIFLSGKESTILAPDGSLVSMGEGNVSLIGAEGTNVAISGGDVLINASGDITMSCGGKITLKGSVDLGNGPAYEAAMTGDSFVAGVWALHTHVAVLPGVPVTPPTTPPPIPFNGLSTCVRVSK